MDWLTSDLARFDERLVLERFVAPAHVNIWRSLDRTCKHLARETLFVHISYRLCIDVFYDISLHVLS